jgi:DNA-directed RNA polymerase specialized sigma24 family protein
MERFEEIYGAYRGTVKSYVRRRAPADLVEDVVADVFVVCLRRIDDVPSVPLPWLYAVARKTLANERRRRARTAPAEVAVVRDPEPLGDSALSAAFAELGRERSRDSAACRLGGTLAQRERRPTLTSGRSTSNGRTRLIKI